MRFGTQLNGRTIVVTGAAGLLGAEHSRAVLSAGGSVLMLDHNQPALEKLAANLKGVAKDQVVQAKVCDITDELAVERSLTEALQDMPPVSGLVNNAAWNPRVEDGARHYVGVEETDLSQLYKEFEVGLGGTFICSRIVASHMIRQGTQGTIVNILSDFALLAPDQSRYTDMSTDVNVNPKKPIGYSIVKHGQLGIMRYLATYWANFGIRVNALSPGAVENQTPPAIKRSLVEGIPLGRMAKPNEFRAALIFLLSDQSSFMTGANLVIDGGRSVW